MTSPEPSRDCTRNFYNYMHHDYRQIPRGSLAHLVSRFEDLEASKSSEHVVCNYIRPSRKSDSFKPTVAGLDRQHPSPSLIALHPVGHANVTCFDSNLVPGAQHHGVLSNLPPSTPLSSPLCRDQVLASLDDSIAQKRTLFEGDIGGLICGNRLKHNTGRSFLTHHRQIIQQDTANQNPLDKVTSSHHRPSY
jgi:hypothetical protein